jgi:hypothetical protein
LIVLLSSDTVITIYNISRECVCVRVRVCVFIATRRGPLPGAAPCVTDRSSRMGTILQREMEVKGGPDH